MEKHQIGMRLRSLNNLIMRLVESSASREGNDSPTGVNGWIIRYIAEHPEKDIFQKDLENRFSITRSTASKVLTLMERKGLIVRQSVPQDKRLRKIALTPKALEIHEKRKKGAVRFDEALTSGFSDEELNELNNYLQRMKENVNKLLR